MIPILQIIILALVQGITEFLPISSSAHLILLPKVAGWQDQGLSIDVAVHFGTLCAVMLYFRQDVIDITTGGLRLIQGKMSGGGDLFLKLVVATIPVVIIGFLVCDLEDGLLRKVEIIGWTSLIFGLVLYVIDTAAPIKRSLKEMTYGKSLLIGLAQTCALIPGTSRAGACITALRLLGFTRTEAARYSCLMSMPTIFAAATLIGYKLLKAGNIDLCLEALIAAGLSFITSLVSIMFMMRWVQNSSFSIFIIYRVVLGIALLIWIYQ